MTIKTERSCKNSTGVRRNSFWVPGHELSERGKKDFEEIWALLHLLQRRSSSDTPKEVDISKPLPVATSNEES